MTRRETNIFFLLGLFLICIFPPAQSLAEGLGSREIIQALQSEKDIFYPFNHKHEFRNVGIIDIKEKRYFVVYYRYNETWHEAHLRGGSFPHGSQRLLIFDGTRSHPNFLGCYAVDMAPARISGRVIKFNYVINDPGDTIVFDDLGPPKQVLLDGEYRGFGK